jgi:hypothetical protein
MVSFMASQGKRDLDPQAAFRGRAGLHTASMGLGDILGNGKPHSRASGVAAAGAVDPVETVEQSGQGLGGYPGSRIPKVDDERVTVPSYNYPQPAPWIGVSQAVAQEVAEELG